MTKRKPTIRELNAKGPECIELVEFPAQGWMKLEWIGEENLYFVRERDGRQIVYKHQG